ncbi:MAG TPA: dephospho-CoA kinase [Clostridiales bacterium]|jgi:dephospho-CoA kinase|nr:dephospho-CoA kinase [Clostridiales bacterium]
MSLLYTLGLTGASGSGKGYISEIFARRNVESLDTDALYHSLTGSNPALRDEALMEELKSEFGNDIISPDGSLCRPALRERVFNSPEKLKRLNEIAHPHVISAALSWIKEQRKSGRKYCIIDAPLLFESGMNDYCDWTIGVIADRALRVSRIIKRDGIFPEAAEKRISNQPDNEFYQTRCDFIIVNDEGHNPELQVDIILQKLNFMV